MIRELKKTAIFITVLLLLFVLTGCYSTIPGIDNETPPEEKITKYYPNETLADGKNGSISALYDYHFMVQTSTGQWAEKHGIAGDSILWDKGMTPNDIPWVLNDKEYYNSRIIYIAVGG